ncbi:Tubulin--tyrosine ligase-like protein 12 [Mortierella sp. AD032]|nr:Tubulin--tyrosine ligase-like protein 12 [Mortierella sp. AD032]
MEYKQFLQIHQYQLAGIPENLWEPLFQKLGQDLFDAGEYLELHYGDPLDKYSLHVKKEGGLKKHGDIFLVDHAWTTKPETSRAQLLDNPQLVERLTSMMDISVDAEEEETVDEAAGAGGDEEVVSKNPDLDVDQAMVELVASQGGVTEHRAKVALQNEKGDILAALMSLTLHPDHDAEGLKNLENTIGGQVKRDKEAKAEEKKKQDTVNKIMSEMWKFSQTYEYAVVDPTGQTKKESAWYIMDEVGSSMAHSDTPNCICAPFIYVGRGTVSYSIIYPIEDIPKGSALTRDFVPADIKDPMTRKAYLQIYNDEQDAAELIAVYESDKLEDNDVKPFDQPFTKTLVRTPGQHKASDRKLRLYTTTEWVATNCKLPNVELVDSEDQADLLWFSQDFKEFDKLTKGQKINQFENESCVTFKQNLAALVKSAYGTVPWSSTTYNLTTELAPFVGHYLWNQEHNHRNLWICKPWNLARGLQITIHEDLAPLVRLRDTGPKIAQEYIQTPVLYEGRKFDLRYIVLLKATHKVEGDPSQGYEFQVMVYKMFWIRLANHAFDLNDFDNYEKHFTVMNYGNYNLTQLLYTQFIENFEKEHADKKKWSEIQADINEAIKSIFAAAVCKPRPEGLGAASDKAKPYEAFSVYGIDVMLKDECQPVVVEVNFSPDCTRACKYDPDFLNNILTVVEPRAGSLDKALGAFNVL